MNETFNDNQRVTISIGLAMWEPAIAWIASLAKRIKALYQAKELGRNRVISAEAGQPHSG